MGQTLAFVGREIAGTPQYVQIEFVRVHAIRAVEAFSAHDVGGDKRIDLGHVRQIDHLELEQVGKRGCQGDLLRKRVAPVDAAGNGEIEVAGSRT